LCDDLYLLIIAPTCFGLSSWPSSGRSKHVGAIIIIVQQFGIKYYVCNLVAWKMYNIKCFGKT